MRIRAGRRCVGRKWASWMWLGPFLQLSTSACGETRSLELFSKKPPAPPPEMPGAPVPETLPPAPTLTAPLEVPPGMPLQPCDSVEECPPDHAFCVAKQCVQCVEDSDCSGKLTCLDNACVECRTDEQCPMAGVCHLEVARCTEPCTLADQCKNKDRKVCDAERGFCVGCLRDEDCDDKHVCDTLLGSCVGCNTNVDCGDAGVCDVARHECAPTPP